MKLTDACSPNMFRKVPTFGWSTIQRFHNNVLEMKKLAACDFEDILQVGSTPFTHNVDGISDPSDQRPILVFEGLLPKPFDGMLQWLLYRTAEWHALAKLRIHTDSTLDLLEAATKELGQLM